MAPEEHDKLKELLKDSESCPRLTSWEEEFLASLRQKVNLHRDKAFVSDKQMEALVRIEAKVYAV